MANLPRHFIDLWDIEPASLRAILEAAKTRKAARGDRPKGARDDDQPAKDHTLAMIFEKNSTRTWFSFDAAIRQLGGASIIATNSDMQLGRGETVEDTARVLSRMVDIVMIRSKTQATQERFARRRQHTPDQRGSSDRGRRPLSDRRWTLMTFEEHRRTGRPGGRWLRSATATTCARASSRRRRNSGFASRSPARQRTPQPPTTWRAPCAAGAAAVEVVLTDLAKSAVRDANAVMTDTWVSMGDEDGKARLRTLRPYQVDEALMALAAPTTHSSCTACPPTAARRRQRA